MRLWRRPPCRGLSSSADPIQASPLERHPAFSIGWAPCETMKDEFLPKYTPIPAGTAREMWEVAYESSKEHCAHGPSCKHGPFLVAVVVHIAPAGSACEHGKRMQQVDVITGRVMAVWEEIGACALLRVGAAARCCAAHAETLPSCFAAACVKNSGQELTKTETALKVVRVQVRTRSTRARARRQLDSGDRVVGLRFPSVLLPNLREALRERQVRIDRGRVRSAQRLPTTASLFLTPPSSPFPGAYSGPRSAAQLAVAAAMARLTAQPPPSDPSETLFHACWAGVGEVDGEPAEPHADTPSLSPGLAVCEREEAVAPVDERALTRVTRPRQTMETFFRRADSGKKEGKEGTDKERNGKETKGKGKDSGNGEAKKGGATAGAEHFPSSRNRDLDPATAHTAKENAAPPVSSSPTLPLPLVPSSHKRPAPAPTPASPKKRKTEGGSGKKGAKAKPVGAGQPRIDMFCRR